MNNPHVRHNAQSVMLQDTAPLARRDCMVLSVTRRAQVDVMVHVKYTLGFVMPVTMDILDMHVMNNVQQHAALANRMEFASFAHNQIRMAITATKNATLLVLITFAIGGREIVL